MPSPPKVARTPVPPAQAAASVLPVDLHTPELPASWPAIGPCTPVSQPAIGPGTPASRPALGPGTPASRSAIGPGTPAGEGLPALSLLSQWQMQLLQLQAMQQAMASVPYKFTGQHPFQPPGFGVGDMFGPPSTSKPTAPESSMAQPAHPGQDSGSDCNTPPPGLSSAEWEAVRRFRLRGAVGAAVGPGPNEEEPGPVGGHLLEFVGAWEDITSDKWVLQTVLLYRVHRELPVNQSTSVDKNPVKTQASYSSRREPTQDAAKKGNSSSRPLYDRARVLFLPILGGEVVRRMATHPKPIALERRGKTQKFKMDTLQSVLNMLGVDIKLYQDGCPPGTEVMGPWAVSLDLQDAYFHVTVDPRDRKFLRSTYD